jgi:outer membrane protein OmpA-like peptidoglycan-associated protein
MTDHSDRPQRASRRRVLALAAAAGLALAQSACTTPSPAPTPSRPPEPPERHAVFFEPDSAALDASAQELMARLAREIRAAPAREILIESFANRAPDGSQNRVLADQRADAITRAFEAGGVDPRLVRSIVIGESARIGPSGLEGRRVDVTILR